MRRLSLGLAALLIAGLASTARANPLLECAVMSGEPAALDACLDGLLEVSYGALDQALALARGRAETLDRAAGVERACAISLTRTRTDALVRLSAPRAD